MYIKPSITEARLREAAPVRGVARWGHPRGREMKLWWYLLHGWVGHAAGSIVCWWRNDHVVIYETGVLPWVGAPLGVNNDADASSYWERTYCIRCGVALKEGSP